MTRITDGVTALVAMRAWQQIEGKAADGVVSMEEFKLDFAARIPGLFELVAETLAISAAQVKEMIRQGKLTWGDVRP